MDTIINKIYHILIVSITIIIATVMYRYQMNKPFYKQSMGLMEILCFVGAFILIYFSIYAIKKSILLAYIATLVIMPIVYMSLKKLTLYLTVDEIKTINEMLNITDSDAFTKVGNHWQAGDGRTNYILIGTVLKFIPVKLLASKGIQPEQIVKTIHWLIGIITIDIIVMFTYSKILNNVKNDEQRKIIKIPKKSTARLRMEIRELRETGMLKHIIINTILDFAEEIALIVILFYAIMSIQVTLVALKTVNYDQNSLLLALLSIIFMIYEIEHIDIKSGIAAVICAMLATQDKMIAGPILYLTLMVLTLIVTYKNTVETRNNTGERIVYSTKTSEIGRNKYRSDIISIRSKKYMPQKVKRKWHIWEIATIITLFPVLLSYISNYYVAILAKGNIPSKRFCDIVYPYVQYAMTVLVDFGATKEVSNKTVIINILMLWCILCGISYIAKQFSESDKNIKKLIMDKKGILSIVGIGSMTMLLVLAIIYIYAYPHIYMSPIYPIMPEKYKSGSFMNGITYHFNASGMIEHYMRLAGSMIYIFYKSIPIGYIILLEMTAILTIYYHRSISITNIFLMFMSGIIFPLLYTAIQSTPNERYQNIYILIFAYLTVVTICQMIFKNEKKLLFIILIIALLNVVDVSRFGYAYTEYFALWDTGYIKEGSQCVAGQNVPGYHGGWGEHVIYAGEWIAEHSHNIGVEYSDITIHYNYAGHYLNNGGMNIVNENSSEWSVCEIGDNDYFVISRGAAIKEGADNFALQLIENIEPIYSFGYNGATELWIYTGEQVEEYRSK